MDRRLFDKQINVTLRRLDGTQAVIRSDSPGRKPTIRISGRWVAQDLLQQVEIRMTNLRTDVPLSSYNSATIEAGYSGALDAAIQGQIINSYQEIPGPDGVTVFQMLIGNFDDWTRAVVSGTWESGTPLIDILQTVCQALGVNLKYQADPSLRVFSSGISWNGLAKNLLEKLRQMFSFTAEDGTFTGLMIMPFGSDLVVWNAVVGTGIIHVMNYVSHVKHVASGFDIQGPWIPSIKPGDTVQIDPKFFQQDFGGSLVAAGTLFQVYMTEFEFCTTDDTNTMTLLTVGAQ